MLADTRVLDVVVVGGASAAAYHRALRQVQFDVALQVDGSTRIDARLQHDAAAARRMRGVDRRLYRRAGLGRWGEVAATRHLRQHDRRQSQ